MVLKRLTWPAELTLTLIGGKWKGLILHQLLLGESKRFGELKRLLPGISAKMLTKYLKELEFDGLITRLETQGLHPRILYTPTQRSHSLSPILAAILQWGEQHLEVYGTPKEGATSKEEIDPSLKVERARAINAKGPWEANLSHNAVSQWPPVALPD